MRGLILLLAVGMASLAGGNDDVQDLRSEVDRPWTPWRPAASAPPSSPAKADRSADRSQDRPAPRRCDDTECRDDDDSNTIGGELLGAGALLGGIAVTTPVWAPRSLVDDGQTRSGWFTDYPYQFHNSYLTFGPPREGDPEPWDASPWSLRVESDYGTNFGGQQLLGGHVLWEHYNQLGLETRFQHLQDEVAGRTDGLWFGDLNGTYRFAQSEHWLFRAGLGMNWLIDGGDDHYALRHQLDVPDRLVSQQALRLFDRPGPGHAGRRAPVSLPANRRRHVARDRSPHRLRLSRRRRCPVQHVPLRPAGVVLRAIAFPGKDANLADPE
jgi:hypothetical protein